MHELSIAQNIVELSTEESKKQNMHNISEIYIEIGSMSGVILEALEFAMEEAVKGSVLESAKINYLNIQAKAVCSKCKNHFDVDDFFAVCPKCGSFETDINSGKDLKIKKIKFV